MSDLTDQRILVHELGNKVMTLQARIMQGEYQGVSLGDSELDEIVETYHELSDAFDREGTSDADKEVEKAIDDLEDVFDDYLTGEAAEKAGSIITTARGVHQYTAEEQSGGRIDFETILEPASVEGAHMEYESEVDPTTAVCGDESLAIVTNTLVKNWQGHGSEGVDDPKLYVGVREAESEYVLDIVDNGPGMDSTAFDEERNAYGGESGLGLYLVDSIVDDVGGELTYLEEDEVSEQAKEYVGSVGAGVQLRYQKPGG